MWLRLPKVSAIGPLLLNQQRVFTMQAGGADSKKSGDAHPSVENFKLKGSTVLAISRGDLTQWEGDAIVNAANPGLLGGGGVDGAIHRAAGPQLVEACSELEFIQRGVRCPPGEARITPGFRLKAKHVIHTVGPVFSNSQESAPILRNAFMNSLIQCKRNELKTVAFPAISCGVYGYPPREAAEVAIETILEFGEGLGRIEFVLFGKDTYEPFIEEATKVLERLPESTSDEGKKCDGEAKAPKDANGGAKESDADSEKAPEAKEAQDAMVESSQTEEVDACDPIVGSSPAKETDEAVSKSQTGKADSDGNGGDEK